MFFSDAALRGDYVPRDIFSPIDWQAAGFKSKGDMVDTYLPNALEGSTAKGEAYGIPGEFDATAFSISTRRFQAAGLDPNRPPRAWSDVGEMGLKLTKRENGFMTHEGFNFISIHQGWITERFQVILHQLGGRIVNEEMNQARINSPRG